MRTLLIDADLLVYRFAHAHSYPIPWDELTWSMQGDLGAAEHELDRWLDWLQQYLSADRVEIFLSDPKANWRHDLYPDYKGTRAAWQAHRLTLANGGLPPKPGPQRPLLYAPIRQHLLDRGAKWMPSLEGDDMVGIAATAPGGGERVIVSSDKDLRTVPGLLFNPDRAEDGLIETTARDAAHIHMVQTLTGDRTDNYPGCPGVGPVKAESILSGLDGPDVWPAVVRAYEKVGLGEPEALVQARIARVLRHGEYNPERREVTLWTPTTEEIGE